jgi:mono/diheme cytochrome c family protein
MGLVIYLTYFFTLAFSRRPPAPPPAPVPESGKAAAKTIDEVRAEERKLLTTYGPVNPLTKTVRIPVERAMDLIVAETAAPTKAAPAKPAPAPAAAPAATTVATPAAPATKEAAPAVPVGSPAAAPAVPVAAPAAAPAVPVASSAAAPAPVRAGMAPDQLYRAICIACHDVDGRGAIVRKAMPTIPDLTDAKWQATRSDTDLLKSILEGKGQFMLSMKDKFALARTDPKEMVAFMRAFQSGKQVVAGGVPAQASVPGATSPVVTPAPTVPVGPSAPVAAPAASPVTAASTTPPPAPAAAPAMPISPVNPAQALPPPAPSVAALSPMPSFPETPSTGTAPAPTANLQAAADFYRINCLACHGQDGRGTAVRLAMPVIPDFTTREWQMGRDNPQLTVSILEGKGALMPPWRGRLTPELAQDLVAYVRNLGPPGLVAMTSPRSQFKTRFKQLQKQWEDINVLVEALSRP